MSYLSSFPPVEEDNRKGNKEDDAQRLATERSSLAYDIDTETLKVIYNRNPMGLPKVPRIDFDGRP